MKKSRIDLFLLILALLLALAMALTLIYGRDHSRHGYGHQDAPPGIPVPDYGRPRSIG